MLFLILQKSRFIFWSDVDFYGVRFQKGTKYLILKAKNENQRYYFRLPYEGYEEIWQLLKQAIPDKEK